MNKFQLAILFSLTTSLTGCFLEGDNGSDGVAGAQGVQGINGQNGVDAPTSLEINLVGRAILNAESAEGAAEIVAFQKSTGWIYAVNSSGDTAVVEILDTNNLDGASLTPNGEGVVTNTNLTSAITLNVSDNSAGDANSIAVDDVNELLAVAMAADETGTKGVIAFYDISGAQPTFIKNVEVGYLPDSIAFAPDGSKAVVANEGEPSGDYLTDPVGSISIIDISAGQPANTAVSIGFASYNDKQAMLEAQGMKFSNPNGQVIKGQTLDISVEMDLEPEYVAFSEDSQTAFVTFQENNGVAVIDLTDNSLEIFGLGYKDWSQYGLDASDKDGGVNIRYYPNLYGLYQPDTIASFSWQGANFIVIANEGDGREYFFEQADEATCMANGGLDYDEDDGCLSYTDEIRASKLTLGEAFDGINNDNSDLGRLKVIEPMGDENNDGVYEKLYTYGGRSFSIFDQNGLRVFDSGDDMERITASIHGAAFNNDEDVNEGDTRSDAKGPEPEALAIGKVGKNLYAFIGLERMAGVMVYNITNPHNVTFVDYFINRGTIEDEEITGDLAPEGMKFVAKADSPTGEAMLIIGNEISGSVSVWQIAEK